MAVDTGTPSVERRRVERSAAVLPATTTTSYFTASGKIRIIDIIGEVTTVFDGTANSIQLIANPTVGADVNLCAGLIVTSDAAGTMYSITGTFANPMIASTSGAYEAQANDVIVAAGTIDLSASATDTTGATKWTVIWEAIDSGATLVAA